MNESLIKKFLKKIQYIASTLRHNSTIIEKEDLINSGVIGLLDAYKKFEKSKNVKFSTFAEFRIKGSMLDEIRSAKWHSRGVGKKLSEIKKAYKILEGYLCRSINEEEIAEFLDISMDKFYENINAVNISNFEDLITDPKYDSMNIMDSIKGNDINLDSKIFHIELEELISKLSKKDQYIIILYFYLDYPMIEIGNVFKISESAISLRIKKILKQLKETINGKIEPKKIENKEKIKKKSKKHISNIQYIKAKEGNIHEIIKCVNCQKEFIKKYKRHIFCNNSGPGNCKDKYWSRNRKS